MDEKTEAILTSLGLVKEELRYTNILLVKMISIISAIDVRIDERVPRILDKNHT